MTTFHRAGTWGEGTPLPIQWGGAMSVWGGYFFLPNEFSHLGTVLCALTPTVSTWLDLLPTLAVQYDDTPVIDITYDDSPTRVIQYVDSPATSVWVEGGWTVLPIIPTQGAPSGNDYDNMLFVNVMGGGDPLSFWINYIGTETAVDNEYDDVLKAQVFD
jgi:hypothetical protein